MTDSASEATVGVIGFGLMGSALADVLMAQGYDFRVWNRIRDKTERFADAGVRVCDSVEQVASECNLLVVCLTDQVGVSSALPSVIDGLLAEALRRGHAGDELPALFEVLSKPDEKNF